MRLHPGYGKCLGLNTPIIMYDGTIKMVQDIISGELIMGDDSTPRKILNTCKGNEQMYKIELDNGEKMKEIEDEEEIDLAATFVPIWQLVPWPLFAFEGGRAGARALASALSDREGEVGRIARAAVEEAARGRRERAAAEAKEAKEKASAGV